MLEPAIAVNVAPLGYAMEIAPAVPKPSGRSILQPLGSVGVGATLCASSAPSNKRRASARLVVSERVTRSTARQRTYTPSPASVVPSIQDATSPSGAPILLPSHPPSLTSSATSSTASTPAPETPILGALSVPAEVPPNTHLLGSDQKIAARGSKVGSGAAVTVKKVTFASLDDDAVNVDEASARSVKPAAERTARPMPKRKARAKSKCKASSTGLADRVEGDTASAPPPRKRARTIPAAATTVATATIDTATAPAPPKRLVPRTSAARLTRAERARHQEALEADIAASLAEAEADPKPWAQVYADFGFSKVKTAAAGPPPQAHGGSPVFAPIAVPHSTVAAIDATAQAILSSARPSFAPVPSLTASVVRQLGGVLAIEGQMFRGREALVGCRREEMSGVAALLGLAAGLGRQQ